MKTKYVKGQGLMILFESSRKELKMALDTLYALRSMSNTDKLDSLIYSLQKELSPLGNVRAICELCWTPINQDTHRKLYLADGRCVHENCP